MKKVTILFALVIMVFSQACATTGTPPSKVKSAFAKKFPTAKKVKWDKENDTEWEAEFKMNGKEYSANFINDGTWKETEFEIKKSEIPTAVKTTLDKEFAGYKIEEVEVSETVNGKVYEFALEKGEEELEIAISPNGKVTKKKVKSQDDED